MIDYRSAWASVQGNHPSSIINSLFRPSGGSLALDPGHPTAIINHQSSIINYSSSFHVRITLPDRPERMTSNPLSKSV
jgi:hypothetical protein